jgi:hypothetical protein
MNFVPGLRIDEVRPGGDRFFSLISQAWYRRRSAIFDPIGYFSTLSNGTCTECFCDGIHRLPAGPPRGATLPRFHGIEVSVPDMSASGPCDELIDRIFSV